MELDGLPFPDDIADRHAAGAAVRPDQVSYQKIAPLEPIVVLINDDTDVQGSVGDSSFLLAERLKGSLEAVQRRGTTQLVNHISLSLRHDVALPDRPAALRHHGADAYGARHRDPDQSAFIHLIIEQHAVLAQIVPPSGQPPDRGRPGAAVRHECQHLVHRRRKGIGQQEEDRRFRPSADMVRPFGHREHLFLLLLGERRSQGGQMGSREPCRPQGHGGRAFDLFCACDHPFSGAPQQHAWPEHLADRGGQLFGPLGIMGGEEQTCQVGSARPQPASCSLCDGPACQGRLGVS